MSHVSTEINFQESVPWRWKRRNAIACSNRPGWLKALAAISLEADPENSKAILMLLLAITDQFETSQLADVSEANRLCDRLPGEYEREYYAGVISERKGKVYIMQNCAGRVAGL